MVSKSLKYFQICNNFAELESMVITFWLKRFNTLRKLYNTTLFHFLANIFYVLLTALYLVMFSYSQILINKKRHAAYQPRSIELKKNNSQNIIMYRIQTLGVS